MTRPRILLADDHTMLLDAFRALLEPEVEVVGTATDGRMLIEEFSRLKPDVVVIDVGMPLLNGLDAGRQLKALQRSVKLIYLTMNPEPDLAREALRLGASGYVLKSSAAGELKQAIHEALKGRFVFKDLRRVLDTVNMSIVNLVPGIDDDLSHVFVVVQGPQGAKDCFHVAPLVS